MFCLRSKSAIIKFMSAFVVCYLIAFIFFFPSFKRKGLESPGLFEKKTLIGREPITKSIVTENFKKATVIPVDNPKNPDTLQKFTDLGFFSIESSEIKKQLCPIPSSCLMDIYQRLDRVVFYSKKSAPPFQFSFCESDAMIRGIPFEDNQVHSFGGSTFYFPIPKDKRQENPLCVRIHNLNGRNFQVNLRKHIPKEQKYFLTAVLVNRVFNEDLFNITFKEIREWMEYLFMSGVEHIYVYENHKSPAEIQLPYYLPYIENGLVTWNSWPFDFGNSLGGYKNMQDSAYGHVYRISMDETEWQIQVDVDEYPIHLQEDNPVEWIPRLIRSKIQENPRIRQMLMSCMFFGDPYHIKEPSLLHQDKLLIDAYLFRRLTDEGNSSRVKPIYHLPSMKPDLQVHQNKLKEGITINLNPSEVRFNHYWGFRCEETCSERDTSIEIYSKKLKEILVQKDKD